MRISFKHAYTIQKTQRINETAQTQKPQQKLKSQNTYTKATTFLTIIVHIGNSSPGVMQRFEI